MDTENVACRTAYYESPVSLINGNLSEIDAYLGPFRHHCMLRIVTSGNLL